MPEIKICGITTEEELQWLIEEQVEYAGFVIWEKSKINSNFFRVIKIISKSLYISDFNI